jgi:8-oxo-dGTP pyrophosphatase MutT (NUDIX family)
MAEKAAVLVLFRTDEVGREVLLIRRIEFEGDPWSGQMAFPGGRTEPSDRDLLATAMREANEEVGLLPEVLMEEPTFLGTHRARIRQGLTVGVFVAYLRAGAEPTLSAGPEVASFTWIPLRELKRVKRMVTPVEGSAPVEAEGMEYGSGIFVWGLTYRILNQILEGPEGE